MSTGERLDFAFGRTPRAIERRLSSADAMLCLCSPVFIAVAGKYGVEGDRCGRKISDIGLGIFLVALRV